MDFKEQVNEVVSKATVDDKGNLKLPEGSDYSEEVLYAAKLEKRHRDTQSSYTKSQQRIKSLENENAKLAENWEKDAIDNLTTAERADLEELKLQDVDAYVSKVAEIKQNAKTKFEERRTNLSKEINQMTELERRQAVLEEHNKNNPDAAITDDILENDLPPRLVRQLEKGDIEFEDFLNQAVTYLHAPKGIKDSPSGLGDPDLSKSGGSDAPSDDALSSQSSSDYSSTIF